MEATLRIACLLAGLLCVYAQCPPSWVKVENSCYRAFGQMRTFDQASQACKSFTGCDGISPGHLACPSSFEERRAVRKLRFDILQPLRGNTIGEGQRLRPRTVWLGMRLGQGANTSWESSEMYDNRMLDQHWGPNRLQPPNTPPQRQNFDPTDFRWNGRCMTLPGQMQMNGAIQKWGHIACNMQAAYICEISPPGTVNSSFSSRGSFNASTGMGPGMPGQGWNPNAGRGQGAGQWPGQGGNPQQPGRGGGNQPQWPGQNNPGQGNPGQGWNPNAGRGQGAGQWPGQGGNPQQPGRGGGNQPQWPGQNNPGQGGWNPNQGNPRQPRMYQQMAMP